jgi:hypothetical protein
MTDSKHTPGPWIMLDDDEWQGLPFIPIEAATKEIGQVTSSMVEEADDFELTDEDRANARLIIAAPDLLEALIKTRAAMASFAIAAVHGPAPSSLYDHNLFSDPLLNEIDDAIIKATKP